MDLASICIIVGIAVIAIVIGIALCVKRAQFLKGATTIKMPPHEDIMAIEDLSFSEGIPATEIAHELGMPTYIPTSFQLTKIRIMNTGFQVFDDETSYEVLFAILASEITSAREGMEAHQLLLILDESEIKNKDPFFKTIRIAWEKATSVELSSARTADDYNRLIAFCPPSPIQDTVLSVWLEKSKKEVMILLFENGVTVHTNGPTARQFIMKMFV